MFSDRDLKDAVTRAVEAVPTAKTYEITMLADLHRALSKSLVHPSRVIVTQGPLIGDTKDKQYISPFRPIGPDLQCTSTSPPSFASPTFPDVSVGGRPWAQC